MGETKNNKMTTTCLKANLKVTMNTLNLLFLDGNVTYTRFIQQQNNTKSCALLNSKQKLSYLRTHTKPREDERKKNTKNQHTINNYICLSSHNANAALFFFRFGGGKKAGFQSLAAYMNETRKNTRKSKIEIRSQHLR